MGHLEIAQAGSEPSSGAESRRSIAATSWGVAGRMEGHPNVFSRQTNFFASPSARGTWSRLDRRKPPRKCRLKECSPGETWYTGSAWAKMAPDLRAVEEDADNTTLTDCGAPALTSSPAEPGCGPDHNQARKRRANFVGARHSWIVAPTSVIHARRGVSHPWDAASTFEPFGIVVHSSGLHQSA